MTYKLTPEDLDGLQRGTSILVELSQEAGAAVRYVKLMYHSDETGEFLDPTCPFGASWDTWRPRPSAWGRTPQEALDRLLDR